MNKKIINLFFFYHFNIAALIFLTAFASINFLNLVACIALLVGTLQKKKNCLVPYLILTSIYILLYLTLGSWFFLNTQENTSIRNGIVAIGVLGKCLIWNIFKYEKLSFLNSYQLLLLNCCFITLSAFEIAWRKLSGIFTSKQSTATTTTSSKLWSILRKNSMRALYINRLLNNDLN